VHAGIWVYELLWLHDYRLSHIHRWLAVWSTAMSVSSFTPATNSFVFAMGKAALSSVLFTGGSGYTRDGGCNSFYPGCGEHENGRRLGDHRPFTLGSSTTWVETAISFAPAPTSTTYYSYIWYTTTGARARTR